MKNAFFILGFVLVLMFSCKKSEDSSPSYSQDKLSGTWENIEKDDNGCTNQLIITSSSMSEKTICTGSNITANYQSYSFDGKVIKVKLMGLDAQYAVNELTDTKLVLTFSVLGSSEKIEYLRK